MRFVSIASGSSGNCIYTGTEESHILIDAGPIADGETIDDAAKRLMQLVIEVAGGKQTKAEEKGFREISIFKDGVVL